MSRRHWVLGVVLCCSACCLAQPLEATASDDAVPVHIPRFRHTYSLTYCFPQYVSCGITGIISFDQKRWSTDVGATVAGLLLQAEPGLGGLKVGLGYGFLSSTRNFSGRRLGLLGFMGIPYLGFALKAIALRTAYMPWHLPAGQLYIGAEAQANLLMLNVNLGLLAQVDGTDWSRPWAATWGVGVGF
jgi:hypothetical protein